MIRPSVAIQLKPSLKEKGFETKSLKYLERYFEDHKFKVGWTDNESFIYKLFGPPEYGPTDMPPERGRKVKRYKR